MISVCIFAPLDEAQAINAAMAELGRGADTLSIPMRGMVRVESMEQATHLGCHWWMESEADAVVALCQELSPNVRIVASSELAGAETQAEEAADLLDAQAGEYIYVPCDPRLIDGLAMGLGELSTPGRGLPYAPQVPHPMAEQYPFLWPLLQLRSEDVVPISLAANSEPLTQVLQAFVDGNGLTAEEMQGLVGAVAAMAGQTIKVAAMIPASWQPYVMTREAAAALGYFGGVADERVLEQFAAGVQSASERRNP